MSISTAFQTVMSNATITAKHVGAEVKMATKSAVNTNGQFNVFDHNRMGAAAASSEPARATVQAARELGTELKAKGDDLVTQAADVLRAFLGSV